MNAIGRWYTVAHELGEDVGIHFGYLAETSDYPEWSILSHEVVDGIGGFARLLRARGETISQMPTSSYLQQPSSRVQAKLLVQGLRGTKRLAWRDPPALRSDASSIKPIAWRVFNEAETERICEASRRQNVTVNSMLLHALDQVIRTYLCNSKAGIQWAIPVNVRTGGSVVADEVNHTAMVQATLGPSCSLRETHLDVMSRLNAGEHWFWWRMIRLFARSPEVCLRHLIGSRRLQTQFLFSNLGRWNKDQQRGGGQSKGHWVFVPPVWFENSLSAGCVTYQGRMALSLHAHPSLLDQGHQVDPWLQQWEDRVRGEIHESTR